MKSYHVDSYECNFKDDKIDYNEYSSNGKFTYKEKVQKYDKLSTWLHFYKI